MVQAPSLPKGIPFLLLFFYYILLTNNRWFWGELCVWAIRCTPGQNGADQSCGCEWSDEWTHRSKIKVVKYSDCRSIPIYWCDCCAPSSSVVHLSIRVLLNRYWMTLRIHWMDYWEVPNHSFMRWEGGEWGDDALGGETCCIQHEQMKETLIRSLSLKITCDIHV